MNTTPSTHLILVRHGETDWNREQRLQGHIDIDLNARGHLQAQAMARMLQNQAIDAIYSSDLRRAQQTAQHVAAQHPLLQLQTHPGLRERHYGVLQGHTSPELHARNDGLTRLWHVRNSPVHVPDGESMPMFHDRVIHTVNVLLQRHAGQTLVIVTHGGVLDVLHRHAQGLTQDTPRSWPLPNCGVHHISISHANVWQVDSWGQVAPIDEEIAMDEIDDSGVFSAK